MALQLHLGTIFVRDWISLFIFLNPYILIVSQCSLLRDVLIRRGLIPCYLFLSFLSLSSITNLLLLLFSPGIAVIEQTYDQNHFSYDHSCHCIFLHSYISVGSLKKSCSQSDFDMLIERDYFKFLIFNNGRVLHYCHLAPGQY